MSVQLSSGRVGRWPESFAVKWNVSSAVMLFLSIVHDWDTVCQEHERYDVLGFRVVARVAVLELYVRKTPPIFALRKEDG